MQVYIKEHLKVHLDYVSNASQGTRGNIRHWKRFDMKPSPDIKPSLFNAECVF